LIDASRAAREEMTHVLSGDRRTDMHLDDHAWEAPDRRPDMEA
jgi:hypothetical protein